jgi:hypothetical protein
VPSCGLFGNNIWAAQIAAGPLMYVNAIAFEGSMLKSIKWDRVRRNLISF